MQVGSSSASLVGKAGVRRTHNHDHTQMLVSCLELLIADDSCPSMAFLLHWMHGRIDTEPVIARREERVSPDCLSQTIDLIDEDVRYVVCAQ